MKKVQIDAYISSDGKTFTGENARAECDAYEKKIQLDMYNALKDQHILVIDRYNSGNILTYEIWLSIEKIIRQWASNSLVTECERYFHPLTEALDVVRATKLNHRFIWKVDNEEDALKVYDYVNAMIGQDYTICMEPFDIIGRFVILATGSAHYEVAYIVDIDNILNSISNDINSAIEAFRSALG